MTSNSIRFRQVFCLVSKHSFASASVGVDDTASVDVVAFSNFELFVWLVSRSLGKLLLSIQFLAIQ